MSTREDELYDLYAILEEFSDDHLNKTNDISETEGKDGVDSSFAEETDDEIVDNDGAVLISAEDSSETTADVPTESMESEKSFEISRDNKPYNKPRKEASPKQKRIKKIIALIVVALVAFLLIHNFGGNLIKSLVNNTALMYKAKVLKADIKELGEALVEQNIDQAETSRQRMQGDISDIRDILGNKFWTTAGKLPMTESQMNDVKTLLDIVEEADGEMIGPLLSLMRDYPLSEIKTEAGINEAGIIYYLRFIEKAIPLAKNLANRLMSLNLSRLDSGGSFQMIMDHGDDIIELLDIAEEADKEIISPLVLIIEEYPFSGLKSEDGINYIVFVKYARWFERIMPEAKELFVRTREIDLSSFIDDNSATEYYEILDETIKLLELAENVDGTVIDPVLLAVEKYPLSDLYMDGGVNAALILNYLTLLENILPDLNELAETLRSQDLPWIESKILLSEYIVKMDAFLELGNEASPYLPIFKCILGNGSDTNILLVAQCLSEMRSTGGFPGHMGTVEIKDGILRIGKLRSVWKVMPDKAPESAGLTKQEIKMFIGFEHPRDAVFCPDYERVASIWVEGYKERQNGKIDSVISVTPVVIQRLLSFLGSIELADGTVMDGNNAVRVLGRDIYFRYFTKGSGYSQREADNYTDVLFREAAEKTLNLAVSNISLSSLPDYFSVFIDGMNDRSIQIWVENEEVQQFIRKQGWNTHLSTDEKQPEIAIFFNSAGNGGSKDSWFLDIDTELSEALINPDGTRSYNVTVSFSNVMTDEEVKAASRYIKGLWNEIIGYVYFFAPSGGTIADFKSGLGFSKWNYEDHNLIAAWVAVKNSRSSVITFTVTTAPGVEAIPIISTNQTNTEYR